MLYADDQWLLFPTKSIYDTLIMAMAVNAAKDMYEKGQQEMKDFLKMYGDFYSPLTKDMEWYNENVIGKVRDTINFLYENGIDPLRSAEGRAAVSRAINRIDVGTVNKLRQSAEIGREFVKNAGIMQAQGKYDPEREEFLNNGATLSNWDTASKGVFPRSAPSEAVTLQEFVHPSFKEIQPHALNEQDVTSRGYQYDPNYEYEGVTKSDMENVMKSKLPGLRGNMNYEWFKELARRDLVAAGILAPTEDQIDRQFIENAITADAQMMTPLTREVNKFKLAKFEADQQIRAARAREAAAFEYDKRRAKEIGKGDGGKDDNVPVIFREAAAKPGAEVTYDVYERPNYQWISPLVQGARAVKGSKGNYAYNIPASSMNSIYKKNVRNTDGTRVSAQWDYGFAMSDATFIPTGQMRMETDFTGQPHYYITGTLANNSTGREVVGRNGTELYEMEVTEQDYSYGKKQATAYRPDN